jgi:hypothetical protein
LYFYGNSNRQTAQCIRHPCEMPFPGPESPLPSDVRPSHEGKTTWRTITRPGACQGGFTNNQSLTSEFNKVRVAKDFSLQLDGTPSAMRAV